MRRAKILFTALGFGMIMVWITSGFAQTAVKNWGFIGNKGPTRTSGWKFVPGDVDGNAGVAGEQALQDGSWSAIRGGFDDPVTATEEQAIVVTGKIEFVGGNPSWWSSLRCGLFYHDSAGVVVNAGTDSAYWTGYESRARGYLLVPHSGVNDRPGWAAGGGGDAGVVRNGNWISTYGNNLSLGFVDQRPRRAEMTEGVYNWAISVRPLGDGTKELRFYMVKEDNSYWWAAILIDTTTIAAEFNGVCFAINGGQGGSASTVRGMYLKDVYVDRGSPIEIPEAPFSPFYVSQWGFIGNLGPTRTAGWRFVPGDVDGNAGVAGEQNLIGGQWVAIRGGFDEEVKATEDKAIVVTGKIEFVGGNPNWWGSLRWGLFYHDSAGVVVNAGTDSAYWTGYESRAYGYLFQPHNGVQESPNWAAGGGGDHGVVRGGAWISTYGMSHLSMGFVTQRPRRAEMTAGVYNWAISVRPLADSTNEVRFYLVKEDNSYWWAGISIDTTQITTRFNGVCFATVGPSEMSTLRAINLTDVYVDRGAPIEIPEAPFSPFYVSQWGFIGGRIGGWKLTPGDVDGNVSVSGTAPPTNWVAIRGGFEDPVELSSEKALLVTGKMELVGGGFEGWSSLRLGVFYSDSAGVVQDSAWTGTELHHYGYLFLPHSGNNEITNWQGIGQRGTVGAVVDRPWISTNGPNDYVLTANTQIPSGAVGGPGVYDFAFSFKDLGEGKTEIRYHIHKEDGSYHFAGILVDAHVPLTTTKFNCVNFALSNLATATAMNLTDVYVDMGEPIQIPDSLLVSVAMRPEKAIPTEYALRQNYPNPFNPTTTIEFALPKASKVTLVVYDALGREVVTLMNSKLNAGYYTVEFDGMNLPSGVYFYTLKTADYVMTRKLTLMK